MKKIIISLLLACGLVAGSAHASGGDSIAWDKVPNKLNDLGALQHGAKLFVNYCLNCHSAAYMRYNRLTDIGLSEQQIKDNMLFPTDKVGEIMKVSLDPKDAKAWFGATPPDLTVIARSRAGSQGSGADYLYTYLRGFYRDETRPTGWNNTVFPNVGMPNVLWQMQGIRDAENVVTKDAHGHEHTELKVSAAKGGLQSQQEFGEPYDAAIFSVLVAVDGLSQQCNFTYTLIGKDTSFLDDVFGRTTLFGASSGGHHTVGAEFVAADHDPDESLKRSGSHFRIA